MIEKLHYCGVTQQWIFGGETRVVRREIAKYVLDYIATKEPAYLRLALAARRTPEDCDFVVFLFRFLGS